jgi:hypothetical protein
MPSTDTYPSGRLFNYMTFHRVRFPSPTSAHTEPFGGPDAAVHWIFGTDSSLDGSGMRTRVSDVWGGAAFYPDLRAAEAVIDDLTGRLPWLSDTLEAWHALLCPISHRGKVNWFGPFEAASQFSPVCPDPGGPLVVLTSAGFNVLPPEQLKADLPRRVDFSINVDRVRVWYAKLPGNLARGVFQTGPVGSDGMTFTLWRNDVAMTQAAYQSGIHRIQVDRYKTEHTADRSSFTRARILRSLGTWDGIALP